MYYCKWILEFLGFSYIDTMQYTESRFWVRLGRWRRRSSFQRPRTMFNEHSGFRRCWRCCMHTCASCCHCCSLFLTCVVNFDNFCRHRCRYLSADTATNRELDIEQRSTVENGWVDTNCIVWDSRRRLTTVPSTSQRNNIACAALCRTRMLLPCNDDTWRASEQPILPLSLELRSEIMAKWTTAVGNICIRQSSTLPLSHSDWLVTHRCAFSYHFANMFGAHFCCWCGAFAHWLRATCTRARTHARAHARMLHAHARDYGTLAPQ